MSTEIVDMWGWGGYKVLLTSNGEYIVEETGRVFHDRNEAFHKCMIDDVKVDDAQ